MNAEPPHIPRPRGTLTTVGKDPFDADEENRRNDEDDEQEELERQERQDEEDDEDLYTDDLSGNFVRFALPIDRYSSISK